MITFELVDAIYEAGTYSLIIPVGIFINVEDGSSFVGDSFVFTVDGSLSGIGAVGAEDGEQVVFDVIGRRVKEITNKGIYIVNGKKILVK